MFGEVPGPLQGANKVWLVDELANMYKHTVFKLRIQKYPLGVTEAATRQVWGMGLDTSPGGSGCHPSFKDPARGKWQGWGSVAAQVKGMETPHLHASHSCS